MRSRRRRKLRPLTEDDKARLLARETDVCGPTQWVARVRAVMEAQQSGDPRMLAGALDDVAAASVIWSMRTLDDHGRWRARAR